MKKVCSLVIVLCALPLVAMAAPPKARTAGSDMGPFYVGGGLSQNSVSGYDGDGTGFQIFGGYELGNFGLKVKELTFAAEVGYMDSGKVEQTITLPFGLGTTTVDTKFKGIWSTAVARYAVTPQFDGIARLGIDLGDDDGLMYGIGGGFWLNRQIQLRGEFVQRDHVDSLQFNAVFRLQ